MLKYLYAKEVFREIPDEISLGISISNCKIHCKGCHSPELWKNRGKALTWPVLKQLLKEHQGISCLLLLGGEADISALTELFFYAHQVVKTAWYCGLDILPKQYNGIFEYLDYYKIGSYKEKLGGLDNPNTNQKLFHLTHRGNNILWEDITKKLQNEKSME